MPAGNSFTDLLGNTTLSQIAEGAFTEDYQKDWKHASKLFRSDNMAHMPRQKFLFHVFFTLQNPNMMKGLVGHDAGLIGALVKSVQLPSFNIDTEEHIQYNRKRLVHNRINYNPVQIVLHDDASNVALGMWQKYYDYYFSDAVYSYDDSAPTVDRKGDYNGRDIYNPVRRNQQFGWGKTLRNADNSGQKLPFFKDIKIFGFSHGKYVAYTLINPVIESWAHDTYDYSDAAGVMQHTATIRYEAVKYSTGTAAQAKGFAEESRYDKSESALGTTASTFGPGGLTDSMGSIQDDLAAGNFGGALRTLGRSATTFGSTENLINVVTGDVTSQATSDIIGSIGEASRGALNFPQFGIGGGSTTATPSSEDDDF